jgi:TRAP-type C4-dicarboxylate transport system permease small subunit
MWSEEVSTICYIYIALLMAPYVYKNDKFVSFALIYDKLSEKGQTIFRLVGNTIIFLIFILLIRPTYIFLTTFKTVTRVLRLPWSVMFWPFLAMVILMICRSFYKIYQDVELILKQKPSTLRKNTKDAKL